MTTNNPLPPLLVSAQALRARLGDPRLALFDCGFQAWQAIGGALTTELPEPTPTTFCEQPDETRWITTNALAAALPSATVQVIDARAPERFRGERVDPRP